MICCGRACTQRTCSCGLCDHVVQSWSVTTLNSILVSGEVRRVLLGPCRCQQCVQLCYCSRRVAVWQGRRWSLSMALLLPAHMPMGHSQPEKPSLKAPGTGAGGSEHGACMRLGSEAARFSACSAGNHAPGQTVTWTGTLAARQRVLGVTLNWCALHAPAWGSVQVGIVSRCIHSGRTGPANSRC